MRTVARLAAAALLAASDAASAQGQPAVAGAAAIEATATAEATDRATHRLTLGGKAASSPPSGPARKWRTWSR